MMKVAVLFSFLACSLLSVVSVNHASSIEGDCIAYSLTGTGDLNGKPISKELVVTYDETWGSRVLFSNEALACFMGDVDGDGLEDPPDNIDALHIEYGTSPEHLTQLFLSLSKDECGMKDGDVFTFNGSGGIVPFLAEQDLIDLTGALDGNVDVDAFTRSPDGVIYFSFAENEDSSVLPAGQPGEIKDGDILRLATDNTLTVFYTEDEVKQIASTAAGSSVSTGDVLGLAFDTAYSCLLFSVQSPSQYDATVFSDMDGGTLVPGFDEAALGYDNAVEFDALSIVPVFNDMPCIELEPRYPQQGDAITLTLSRGTPGHPFFLLLSGALAATTNPPYAGGFGSLPLDVTHAFYMTYITQCSHLAGTFDASGTGAFGHTIPADPMVIDVFIQAVDPISRVYSHPITLELNQ